MNVNNSQDSTMVCIDFSTQSNVCIFQITQFLYLNLVCLQNDIKPDISSSSSSTLHSILTNNSSSSKVKSNLLSPALPASHSSMSNQTLKSQPATSQASAVNTDQVRPQR